MSNIVSHFPNHPYNINASCFLEIFQLSVALYLHKIEDMVYGCTNCIRLKRVC